jgi:hypothetical protein
MIGAIVKPVIALFVDDELLAASILCVIALIGVLTLSGAAPAWVAGLLLALAPPAALAASVVKAARRGMRGGG